MNAGFCGSTRPLVIDGAHGEGGGQILRAALSLTALTGRRFELVNIRANRPKPGLAAQHVAAARAAAAIRDAAVEGDRLGSASLSIKFIGAKAMMRDMHEPSR